MKVESKKRYFRYALLILLFLSMYFCVRIFLSNHKGTNHRVVFLDVGQGDSILIQSTQGKNILIDAGMHSSISRSLDDYISYQDKTIDLAIITHPDLDHSGGFHSLLDDYTVKNIAVSQAEFGDDEYFDLMRKASERNIPQSYLYAGDRISLSEGEYIEILYPAKKFLSKELNEYSLVLRYAYGDQSFLLMGDSYIRNEIELYQFYGKYLDSDVLKLGHHGSKTSSSLLFLDAVSPEYSIVSAACNSRFGHPHENVIEKVRSVGSQIVSSCEYGDIIFEKNEDSFLVFRE